jgi:hypothetical protein
VHSTGVLEEDMPPVFLAWLSENRIDPRVYTLNAKLPRYVRRNPRFGQPSAAEISAQLGAFSLVLQNSHHRASLARQTQSGPT